MLIIKENVELIIDESDFAKYKKAGYAALDTTIIESDEQCLEKLTVPELKKLAEEKGIEGTSSLTKQELLKVLGE